MINKEQEFIIVALRKGSSLSKNPLSMPLLCLSDEFCLSDDFYHYDDSIIGGIVKDRYYLPKISDVNYLVKISLIEKNWMLSINYINILREIKLSYLIDKK